MLFATTSPSLSGRRRLATSRRTKSRISPSISTSAVFASCSVLSRDLNIDIGLPPFRGLLPLPICAGLPHDNVTSSRLGEGHFTVAPSVSQGCDGRAFTARVQENRRAPEAPRPATDRAPLTSAPRS